MNEKIAAEQKEPVRILFGTPVPIGYRETDEQAGQDIEVNVRISGAVYVEEYSKEKYPDEDLLEQEVKDIAIKALHKKLTTWPQGKTVVYNSQKISILNIAVKETLSENGIKAKVEIASFSLTKESEEALKIIREVVFHNQNIYVDEMYKPNPYEEFCRQNYKDLNGWMQQGLGRAPVDEPCKNPEVKKDVTAPSTVSVEANLNANSDSASKSSETPKEEKTQSFMEMMGEITGIDSLNEGEVWVCPNCKTSGNKGNFCPECGTKRPPFGSVFQGL